MHDLKIKRFSLHKFKDRKSIKFNIQDYSKLKYGSKTVADKFGVELANGFFKKHKDILCTKQLAVSESAYNFARNAASLITDAFIDRLNTLMVEYNGNHIHRLKINRIVPYIQDYGKVSLTERINLLKQDTFTFDLDFAKDKFLIFLDDIFITGTHQNKIEEMVNNYGINTDDCMCVYYAELLNPYEDPAIESFLNEAYIKNLDDLIVLIQDDEYSVIVRTIKMLLSSNYDMSKSFIECLHPRWIKQIYHFSLGEGYYKNPAYSHNFSLLRDRYLKL